MAPNLHARRSIETVYLYSMLVAVLKLRDRSRKRSLEELRADAPLVGYIQQVDTPNRRLPRRGQRSALLMPPERFAVEPLAELHHFRHGPWKRGGVLLYGIEEEWRRRERIDHAQVWWIRSAYELQVKTPPPTLDQIEAMLERVIERVLTRVGHRP